MIKKIMLGVLFVLFVLGIVLAVTDSAPSENREVRAVQDAIAAEGLSWEAGETSMTRLSEEERLKRLGGRPGPIQEIDQVSEFAKPEALPPVLDWRNNDGNWVTPIRDQGSCGSCWAFATAGVLESLVKIVKNIKTDVDLSEQTLVSCSGAGDCGGGYQSKAAEYVKDIGIPRESCFPYSATDEACKPCPGWMSKTVKITSWKMYYSKSNTILETALQSTPINAYMDVYSDFSAYKSGIYERTAGSTLKGGHVIVFVGYNVAEKYWICKNSWGTDWGENGFFRIRMGNSNIGKWCVSMSGPRFENHQPVLNAIPAQSVDEGKSLAFTLSATDSDYDALTYSGNNLPDGAVLDATSGAFSWMPTYTQSGIFNILFKVSDGISEDAQTVKITVQNVKRKQW